MPKKKQEKSTETSGIDVLKSHLKANTDDHYNYIEKVSMPKVSTGSLSFDVAIDGGFEPCIIRPVGNTESGKTASSLEFVRNFLSDTSEPRKALYVKCEGRLSPKKQAASGVDFVEKEEEWQNGTCFLLKSNIFEFVINIVRELVRPSNNNPYTRYCFVFDSMDGLVTKEDAKKSFDEAVKVAGGALLSSTFLKNFSSGMHELGHYAILIGQMRSSGPKMQYSEKSQKVGSGSGGNAIQHYADWIFEYYPPKDFIFEDYSIGSMGGDTKRKKIGHYARLMMKKGDKEEKGLEVSYPIQYYRESGSVFAELEIVDIAITLGFLEKKGAWIKPEEFISKKMADKGVDLPEQWQGQKNAIKYFMEDKEAYNAMRSYILDYLKSSQP